MEGRRGGLGEGCRHWISPLQLKSCLAETESSLPVLGFISKPSLPPPLYGWFPLRTLGDPIMDLRNQGSTGVARLPVSFLCFPDEKENRSCTGPPAQFKLLSGEVTNTPVEEDASLPLVASSQPSTHLLEWFLLTVFS